MEIDANLLFVTAALITGIAVALAGYLNRLEGILRKMIGKDGSTQKPPTLAQFRRSEQTFRLLYLGFFGFSLSVLGVFFALFIFGSADTWSCASDSLSNCRFDPLIAIWLPLMAAVTVSWALILVVALRSYHYRNPVDLKGVKPDWWTPEDSGAPT